MRDTAQGPLRRVLIASANPLFARGLERLFAQRLEGRSVEVRLVSSLPEVTAALATWQPDLVIVDYDDKTIQRSAFLSHFITGDQPMKVMLVSLRESGEVVVYDRRTLTPAQAEDWLDLPWVLSPLKPAEPEAKKPAPIAREPARPVVEKTGVSAVAFSETYRRLRSGGMKHYVIAGVLAVMMTFVMAFLLRSAGLLPIAASSQAIPVDSMIDMQLWIISFLFSLIVVFIGYSVVVFRHREGDRGFGANIRSSNTLEVIWTIIPLGTVIVLSFIGARDLAAIRQPDPNAMVVKVTAFQWGWSFEYPDTGIRGNQLYLPVNRQVQLVMSSRDVIHSFWVPEFRIKQDVLPGENLVKELRINPTRIGDYTVYCAELCGGAHAYMNAAVKVVSQADFDAWVAEQTNTSSLTPAQRGEKQVQASGCTGCHSLDGSARPGPTWKGLYGSEVKLADGSEVKADEAYLKEAIIAPNAQVVEGFPPSMMPQNYQSQLTDQQLMDMIEFIKTVK